MSCRSKITTKLLFPEGEERFGGRSHAHEIGCLRPPIDSSFQTTITTSPSSSITPKTTPLSMTDFGATMDSRNQQAISPFPSPPTSRTPQSTPFSIAEFGSSVYTPLQSGLATPVTYDLRDFGLITPVKDQGNCGSCWTFGTYASLESSILREIGIEEDFSENHLKNYHLFDWLPCSGGNDLISTAYLGRGDGPVDEVDDPYHDYDDRPSPGGNPRYSLGQALWFDTDVEIKEALMTWGSLTTSMYFNDIHYNPGSSTYYYSGSANSNHCVAIVGWDDTKIVPGAPTPGAWLIKNSWGVDWGEDGYFWISYADSAGANRGVSFSGAKDVYDITLSYDDYGFTTGWSVSHAFNAFDSPDDGMLEAVGFWTLQDSASYTITIYDDFNGINLSNPLAAFSGTKAHAGYHVIELPSTLKIADGNDFYVALQLADGGNYPMASDIRISGYSSGAAANPGESYFSFDGSSWRDLYTYEPTANFSIKAFMMEQADSPRITAVGHNGRITGAPNSRTIRGRDAAPLSPVRILGGGQRLGTTTSDDNGNFAYRLTPENIEVLGQGTGKFVRAREIDVAGNIRTSPNYEFAIDTTTSTARRDLLTGELRSRDRFTLGSLADSLLNRYDTITNFETRDRLRLRGTRFRSSLSSSSGRIDELSASAIRSLLNRNMFGAGDAAAFQLRGQRDTFIALNDSRPGFQANSDGLFFLEGFNINNAANSVTVI